MCISCLMDPADKNLLISNRPDLVENIDVNNGLFNHLLSLKVLSSRMVQTITYNKPPDKQVEELLDILPKRGQDAFKLFCEALIKSDQENVVTSFLQKKGDHKTPSISTSHINNTCISTPPLLSSEVQSSFVSLQTSSQKRKPDHIPENKPTENVDDAEFISSDVSSPQKRVCSNTASIIRITGNDHKDIFKIYNSETPISTSNIVQTAPLEDSSYTKDEVRYAMKHYITTDTQEEKSQDYVNQKAIIFLSKLEGKYDRQISSKQNCHNLLRISPKEWLSRCDSADTMERKPTHLPNDARHSYLPGHNFSCEILCNKSIDLTDGSVAVRVEPCPRQFYEANKHKSYRMIAKPRGQALIINVNEVYDKPPRRGTNIDRDNLHNLLMQLEFIVTVYNDEDDLTAQGIVNKLRAFASLSEHKKGDASIICLLSHGEEGYIFGTDGKRIPLDETFQLFDNQHCPALLNKPKVFFIQACRGGALDHGVKLQMDEPDGGPNINCLATPAQLPSMSDMLVCYPTQEGYYAWRNRERGSWYIEAVVQIFMSHSKCEDICAMLNRVNELVSRKVSRCPHAEMDSMSQMSEFKSSLRQPYLFFFPGIVSPLDD